MRLIDADVLLTWFNNHYDHEEVTVGYVSGLIKEQSTIDAIPVVRCKDCVFNLQIGTEIHCIHRDGIKSQITADDYCSRAEKEEEYYETD